jgi:hypothetical protein
LGRGHFKARCGGKFRLCSLETDGMRRGIIWLLQLDGRQAIDELYNNGPVIEKYRKLQDVQLEQEGLTVLRIKMDAWTAATKNWSKKLQILHIGKLALQHR